MRDESAKGIPVEIIWFLAMTLAATWVLLSTPVGNWIFASGGDKNATVAKLKEAKAIFETFIQKAAGKPEYDGAVKRSKERMEDIDGTIAFLLASNEPLPVRAPNLDEISPGLLAVGTAQPLPLAAR